MSYLSHFLERKLFGTKVAEKIRTPIICSTTFRFRKSCRLWDNVEKYCRAGQVTNDNNAHAQSMLDSQGYKHNTYCVSTTTTVTRTRLNVTFYVHCLVNANPVQTCLRVWKWAELPILLKQHSSSIYLFLTSALQPTSTPSENTATGPKLTKYLKT
jgi:hypothetical protein